MLIPCDIALYISLRPSCPQGGRAQPALLPTHWSRPRQRRRSPGALNIIIYAARATSLLSPRISLQPLRSANSQLVPSSWPPQARCPNTVPSSSGQGRYHSAVFQVCKILYLAAKSFIADAKIVNVKFLGQGFVEAWIHSATPPGSQRKNFSKDPSAKFLDAVDRNLVKIRQTANNLSWQIHIHSCPLLFLLMVHRIFRHILKKARAAHGIGKYQIDETVDALRQDFDVIIEATSANADDANDGEDSRYMSEEQLVDWRPARHSAGCHTKVVWSYLVIRRRPAFSRMMTSRHQHVFT
ncbi:hypothetical protein B0H19DRAFT_1323480 [Mycena capillaripes]|nr:hypothetical protein B0H19DRAFT_1323480 [Mycena capillaripes]